MTYLDADGKTLETHTLKKGDVIVPPQFSASPVGMTFTGWSWSKVGGEVLAEAPAVMPEFDLIAQSVWKINEHSLSIDGQSTTVAFGTVLSTPPAPAPVEGKTFIGWSWKNGADEVLSAMPATMPDTDLIAVSVWKVNEYVLTINGNDTTVAYGDPVVLPESAQAPIGKAFAGWNCFDADGQPMQVPTTMPAHNVSAVPAFSDVEYTLTWKDGKEELATVKYKYGDRVEPYHIVNKTGYDFDSWVCTDNATGSVVSVADSMPACNVTAEAQWMILQYSLSINYNCDLPNDGPIMLDYGTPLNDYLTDLEDTVSLHFIGWLVHPEGDTNLLDNLETMPGFNIVADAQWVHIL